MMSLRDKFAMAALQGFCSMESNVDWSYEHTAAAAYQQADAMLAEREKNTGNVVLTQAEFSQLRAEIIDCKQQLQALLEVKHECSN